MKAEIETDRLFLRNFKIEDANSMYHTYCTKEIVTRYLTWYPHKSFQQTVNYVNNILLPNIDNPSIVEFAITLRGKEGVIGAISTISPIGNQVEVGYVLDNEYWNQGYMSEALEGMIDFLFTNTQVQKVTACHQLKNIASGKVMINCGMQYVDIIHRKIKLDASNTDTVPCRNYEITREQWEELNNDFF